MKFKGGFYLYMNGFLKPAWKVHFKVNKYILGRIDKEQQKTYSTQDKSIYLTNNYLWGKSRHGRKNKFI